MNTSRFCDLQAGQIFAFKVPEQDIFQDTYWEYRGSCFYSRPWSGGPFFMGGERRKQLVQVIPDESGRCHVCSSVADRYGCPVEKCCPGGHTEDNEHLAEYASDDPRAPIDTTHSMQSTRSEAH